MDALTAKLGKMSKPQIILTAAGAGIAMAIAYRLADRTLDSVLPKKKVEEEEPADEPKAHPAPPAEGAKVLSGCYDVKIGDRVVADVSRCVEINQCVGCNSSRSPFSVMTRPSWLRRAARNRHRHAIEQA